MQLVIDRFEDNELVVLETPEGESLILPHTHFPWYASEGNVTLGITRGQVAG